MVWGTGLPRREFLFVDDLADALVYLMENVDARTVYDLNISQINIGTGMDISIKELAELVARIVGFKGELIFDKTMPDGTHRKLLDVSRLKELGWQFSSSLEDGIKKNVPMVCRKLCLTIFFINIWLLRSLFVGKRY